MMQEDELIFLYKLKDGNVESSFAHSIAEAIGIDTAIITRAKSIFRNITVCLKNY